jgi:hypothetical protein
MGVTGLYLPTQDDGSTLLYAFGYEGLWGELARMSLPTGAFVEYNYAG